MPSLSWKGRIFRATTLYHKMCHREQTTEPKSDLGTMNYFSQEKIPHPLISVIASTYYGKHAVLFLLGHHVYQDVQQSLYNPLSTCFNEYWSCGFHSMSLYVTFLYLEYLYCYDPFHHFSWSPKDWKLCKALHICCYSISLPSPSPPPQ